MSLRIDAAQIPFAGGLKNTGDNGAFAASLHEGDSFGALVLSAGKDSIVLRTDSGLLFKARLDSDVPLKLGEHIFLEVSGKDADTVSLSVIKEFANDDKTTKPEALRSYEDTELFPYAAKLAQLNMPVSEETALSMKQLIESHPDMNLDEAAFIASNGFADDERLIRAAQELLSGGDKTDGMIEKLLDLLHQMGDDAAKAPPGVSNYDVDANGVAQGNPGRDALRPESGGIVPAVPEERGSVSDFIRLVREGEGELAAIYLRGIAQEAKETQEAQVTQEAQDTQENLESLEMLSEGENQTRQLDNLPAGATAVMPDEEAQTSWENLAGEAPATQAQGASPNDYAARNLLEANKPPDQAARGTQDEAVRGNQAASKEFADSTVEDSAQRIQDAAVMPNSLGSQEMQRVSVGNVPMELSGNEQGNRQQFPSLESAREAMTELFKELGEFRNTPAPVLERFSDMLLRISGEEADFSKGAVNELMNQVEQMFAKLGRSDNDAGRRIKDAKDELIARLLLLEESISRTQSPSKGELLEQTRRLQDHARLLNSIEQFAYMEIPIQLYEDRSSAQLYVFKKKGSKRIDPENVNILLSIDLEHMGHWEGLINFRNKDVSLKMEVAGPKEKEHFSENTVLLHELMSEIGFKLVGTDIQYLEKETNPLTALSVFDRLTRGNVGINFTV